MDVMVPSRAVGELGLEEQRGLGAPAVSPEVTSCPNRHMLPDPALRKTWGSSAAPPPTPCWPGCVEAPAPPLHLARFSRGFPLPLAAGDPVTVMLREGFLGERLCSAKDEGVVQRCLGSEREVSQAGTF